MFMDFGEAEYWDRFYQRYLRKVDGRASNAEASDEEQNQLTPYEWYFGAETLLSRLLPHLAEAALPAGDMMHRRKGDDESVEAEERPVVLMLGCGSSTLSEKLYDAGYRNIINVDFSSLAIESMRKRTLESHPHMRWMVMDVTCMRSLPSESVDVAIDKGTLDAVMSSADWQRSAPAMGSEVHRVLRSGGLWIVCSFGDDRAECVDEKLYEEEEEEEEEEHKDTETEYPRHQQRWVGTSKRWRVVREQVLTTGSEDGEGSPTMTEHAWYFYIFTKLRGD